MTTFTREELYELVWSTPASQLAKTLHISDVALAKICKKYSIPKPSLGYWSKVWNDKKVLKKPLPGWAGKTPCIIQIAGNAVHLRQSLFSQSAKDAIAAEAEHGNVVTLPKEHVVSHPLVLKTQAALRAAKKEGREAGISILGCLALKVSAANIERALRIYDVLITTLEKRGYKVSVPTDRKDVRGDYEANARTLVEIRGETVHFWMEERSNKVKPTPAEKERYFWPPYVLKPDGLLILMIGGSRFQGSNFQRQWAESAKTPLEEKLGRFIVALVEASESIKAERLAFEERQLQWKSEELAEAKAAEEKRAVEQAQAEQIARAKHRVDDLEDRLRRWERHAKARAFISEVRQAMTIRNPDPASAQEVDRWIAWVESYLAQTDPITETIEGKLPQLD